MEKVFTRSRITIKAKPSEVFKYLSNTKYHYYWNPSLRVISDQVDLNIGSSYDTEVIILKDIRIKSHVIITDYVKDRLIEFNNAVGAIDYTAKIKLTAKDSATEVTLDINVLTKSKTFGLTLPVLKQLATNELNTDLRSLKVAVENKIGQ